MCTQQSPIRFRRLIRYYLIGDATLAGVLFTRTLARVREKPIFRRKRHDYGGVCSNPDRHTSLYIRISIQFFRLKS